MRRVLVQAAQGDDSDFDLDHLLDELGYASPAEPKKKATTFQQLEKIYSDAGISTKNVFWRADNRPPDIIFTKQEKGGGFQSAGANTDLNAHVYTSKKEKKKNPVKSAFVSTSVRMEGTTTRWSGAGKETGGDTYLYMINPEGLEAIDINETLGPPKDDEIRFSHEYEKAIVGGIPMQNVLNVVRIVNYRPVELTINPNASPRKNDLAQ